MGHPLNAGELKVFEGTHGIDPLELLGGEVGLEKLTTPPKNYWGGGGG